MGFKDDVKSDIHDVFLDTDEMASVHVVNGKSMAISIDEAELARRTAKKSPYEEGVALNKLLFFVAVSDFGAMPKVNSPLVIDGSRFLVADVRTDSGMYEITIRGGKR